jgi:hypothetical protein
MRSPLASSAGTPSGPGQARFPAGGLASQSAAVPAGQNIPAGQNMSAGQSAPAGQGTPAIQRAAQRSPGRSGGRAVVQLRSLTSGRATATTAAGPASTDWPARQDDPFGTSSRPGAGSAGDGGTTGRSAAGYRLNFPGPPAAPRLPVLPHASAVPPVSVVTQRAPGAPQRGNRASRPQAAQPPVSQPATPNPGPVTVSRTASRANQTLARQASPTGRQATVQRIPSLFSARRETTGQREGSGTSSSGNSSSGTSAARARPGFGNLDLDALTSEIARRLRTEFRVDRERFGRLRDSTR